ncbi:MAG: 2-oxo acid dehydrogenase subunit E2 [Candidatus Scatovivens sp.]
MFGRRADGKRTKDVQPFFYVIPHIMKTRCDSQVYFKIDIPLEQIDKYIDKKAEEGIKISYMNVIYAALVRLLNDRPRLNRFIMNGKTYQRNEINISLAIKKNMTDNGTETTIKLPFKGNENIFEIKEKLDNAISKNKDNDQKNDTDIFAKTLSLIPTCIVRTFINFIRILDRYGLLPKSIIRISPFHTSVFLTNVGSLGIDYIYHHLYDFGTTSLFIAMGKKKESYIYEDDEIKKSKCISLGFVGDERICDGYYYASSLKLMTKLLKKPELLESINNEKESEKIK